MSKHSLQRLLGTEPALITGAIQALVGIFVAAGTLSDDASAVIMTVVVAVTGALAAWATENTRLTTVVEVVKAVIAFVVFFRLGGITLTPEVQAAVVFFVTSLGSIFIRSSTSAAPTALSKPSLGYSPQYDPAAVVVAPGTVHGHDLDPDD